MPGNEKDEASGVLGKAVFGGVNLVNHAETDQNNPPLEEADEVSLSQSDSTDSFDSYKENFWQKFWPKPEEDLKKLGMASGLINGTLLGVFFLIVSQLLKNMFAYKAVMIVLLGTEFGTWLSKLSALYYADKGKRMEPFLDFIKSTFILIGVAAVIVGMVLLDVALTFTAPGIFTVLFLAATAYHLGAMVYFGCKYFNARENSLEAKQYYTKFKNNAKGFVISAVATVAVLFGLASIPYSAPVTLTVAGVLVIANVLWTVAQIYGYDKKITSWAKRTYAAAERNATEFAQNTKDFLNRRFWGRKYASVSQNDTLNSVMVGSTIDLSSMAPGDDYGSFGSGLPPRPLESVASKRAKMKGRDELRSLSQEQDEGTTYGPDFLDRNINEDHYGTLSPLHDEETQSAPPDRKSRDSSSTRGAISSPNSMYPRSRTPSPSHLNNGERSHTSSPSGFGKQ